jgi:hypothetical protein
MKPHLLVGTSKGLVVFQPASHGWGTPSVHFEGLPVSMVFDDHRTSTWWVSLSHRHWGEKLHRSADQGKTWEDVEVPQFGGRLFQPGTTASLKKIWVMQGGGQHHQDRLWLGTEPGGLFLSENNGNSFELVESLWSHPSRMDPNQWFGAGKDFPFIHSIEVDPLNDDHVYIAVSCAGVFETLDGGKNWHPCNKGLIAAYLPKPHPEVGHDPHRMLICKQNPSAIWQQNHCGIYRMDRTAAGVENLWVRIGEKMPKSVGDIGFPMVLHPRDPKTCWVFPMDGTQLLPELRVT